MATTKNDPDDDIRTVTLTMPDWVLEDLRKRAKARGISVSELMRRAVSLERMLFEETDNVVTMSNERLGVEKVIRLI